MKYEIVRQLMHAFGLVFILIAQFLGYVESVTMFFIIAAIFAGYSVYISCTKSLTGFRHFALKFERNNIRPFTGAFWFYVGCGISFLLFPKNIASAASAILALGDSVATIIGVRFGRIRINGKTLEGSLSFFVSGVLISLLFVPLRIGLLAVFVATILELYISFGFMEQFVKRGYVDDNLLIPIISGLIMFVLI